MKKAPYKFHVFGNVVGSKILLIHGIGFYWNRCFRYLIDDLSKDYCLIIPELDGHREAQHNVFTSVKENAIEIEKIIRDEFNSKIETVYGISLGASIAMEIARRNNIRISNLIFDEPQFVPLGIGAGISAFGMALQFKKIMHGRHMNKYVQKKMGYSNNDIGILKSMLCKKIRFRTLFKSSYSCYKYDIAKKTKKITCKMNVLYGEREEFAGKSIEVLEESSNNPLSIFKFDNLSHVELLAISPDKLCDIIKLIIKSNIMELTNNGK